MTQNCLSRDTKLRQRGKEIKGFTWLKMIRLSKFSELQVSTAEATLFTT
jgi:hypothetical protein